jgi:hypothetical protein
VKEMADEEEMYEEEEESEEEEEDEGIGRSHLGLDQEEDFEEYRPPEE